MAESTPKTQGKILGRRLVPDLSRREIVENRTRYWFGLLPGAPVDPVHAGHLTFAKVMEIVQTGPGGETVRNPMIGVCAAITKAQVESVVAALPRMIFRFQDRVIGKRLVDGVTEDLAAEEEVEIMRVGHIIRIPTDDEIEIMQKSQTYRPYVPMAEDEPVANYIFMVKQDMRGTEYPEPVSSVGIEIPQE